MSDGQLIFWNRQLLFREEYGGLAMDLACCCNQLCCARPRPGSGLANALPSTLTAIFSSITTCTCIAGMSVDLVWDDLNDYWEGTGPGGGACALRADTFRVQCGDPLCHQDLSNCRSFSWTTVGTGPCNQVSNGCAKSGCACNPLSLEFDISVTGLNCCNSVDGSGSFRVNIDE